MSGRSSPASRHRRTLVVLGAVACAIGMLPGAAVATVSPSTSGANSPSGHSASGTETGNPGKASTPAAAGNSGAVANSGTETGNPGTAGHGSGSSSVPTRNPGAGPASITGPIPSTARPGDPSRNYTFYATPLNLRAVGYQEQEFFISGTATRFPSNPTVDQQRVPATPIGTMPYTTRIVVRSPVNPARSAGIAVVDWQNVTAGHDIDTEWGSSGDFFIKHGWTYIGASVQRVGVNGNPVGTPTGGLGLVQWNPNRYGSLDLTAGGTVLDDSQSFDVYSQIAQLAKGHSRSNPLSGLRLREVLAGGASQSARFLGLYYNTIQPTSHAYDGFLIAIGNSTLPPQQSVGTKVIRVDTENDLFRGIGVPSLRIPDNASLRTWEIAGASHVPAFATVTDQTDFRATLGGIQTREFGESAPLECQNPGPSQVESWAVFHAAYSGLDTWVRTGQAPRPAQPVAVVNPTAPATFLRDANGIALGGIRLPDVDVPASLNDGINAPLAGSTNPLSAFCVLWGTHRDLTPTQLAALYTSNADYHAQVVDDVRRLVGQKFVLPEDANTLIQKGLHTRVR